MTKTNLLVRDEHAGHPGSVRYEFGMAGSSADVRQAQVLRHRVFSTEWNAHTPGPDGLDGDHWDDVAEHLLVRAVDRTTGHSVVVATYRLLPPHVHTFPRPDNFYLNTEFDITSWAPRLCATVEAGRACVAPAHRTATPIALLWGGIARYMHLSGYRYLAGAASIPLTDGGGQALAFRNLARERYPAPAEWHCAPRRPVDTTNVVPRRIPQVPALLAGYLRLGAKVCGDPAFDPAFRAADFPVLLDMQQMNQRYLDRFLDVGGA